jgi:hypothetical protein
MLRLLCFWIFSIVLFLFKTHVSDTGFCLRLQVKPTQLGPIERANHYLQNPVSETVCALNKNRTSDNVQKHNNYINIPLSQTFR